MIRYVVINGARSIELLKKEEMGKIMGCGHGGKRKTEVSVSFDGLWEAVWAAKDDGDVITDIFVGF